VDREWNKRAGVGAKPGGSNSLNVFGREGIGFASAPDYVDCYALRMTNNANGRK